MFDCQRNDHLQDHAFGAWNARAVEGVRLVSRRSTLKAGIAGIAGLSLPALLHAQQAATSDGKPIRRGKSVILLWMTGGPSHIDTWDCKPDAPPEIRGPFGTIATKLPGVRLCEYLPKQAAMLDRLTIIRSVDCRKSNHEPNMVMQTANREAEPRTNPEAKQYPALASIVAQARGRSANPALPPYVVLNMQSRSHVAFAGDLGKQYEPFVATNVGEMLAASGSLDGDRIRSRQELLAQFDRLRAGLDQDGSMQSLDHYSRQAVEMVTGPRAREAFDISRESKATLDRYGEHNWCQQALLARRLVEAGVSFVTHRPLATTAHRHLGHPRRQHPALRRHLERPAAALAACSTICSPRSSPIWTSAACSTTCWSSRWANSAARRRSARKAAPTAAITGRS